MSQRHSGIGWLQDHARRRTVLGATILLGLLLLFYARLWWPGLILIKRDAFRCFAPIKQYMAERLLAGELPQWFPYESMGRSFIGATVTGVFHPFTLLYLALPAHGALRLSTLLSCLLGGLGAFVLGRALRYSRAGAVVAGLAFACSGYVVSTTEAIEYLYGICALPLFCAALKKAIEAGPAWLAAPAAVWATVFLGGDIQTGYYYGFVALLWAGTCVAAPLRQAFTRTACVGLLAGLLAGLQLGPSWAAYLVTERTNPVLFHETAVMWSAHPLRLFTVLASPVGDEANRVDVAHFFFGSLPAGQDFVGLLTDSLYLGAPVIGLALIGGWFRRDLRGLAVLGLAALWLALGRYGGLYEVFYHVVPLWSAFRFPEKLMGFVSFSAAMLAGAGVDELRRGRGSHLFWFVLAALCAGAGGLFRTEALGLWTAAYVGAPAALARAVMESASDAFLYSCLAAAGVGMSVVAVRRGRLPETTMIGVLVAVMVLDLSRANQDVYHTGPEEMATVTPGLVEALRKATGVDGPGYYRIASLKEEQFFSRERLDQWLTLEGAAAMMLKQHLELELNVPYRIESFDRYLPGYNRSLQALDGKPLDLRAAARFNIHYYIGRSAHFLQYPRGVIAGMPSFDLVLFRNPVPVKPRAYLASIPEGATGPVDPSALFVRPDYLSGQVDVIESGGAPLPPPSSGGTVTVERYEPEEVRMRVETAHPAVLILLDAYEAGWRAWLDDGRELPIWRANGLVRAVAVPAGTHQATFAYRTPLLAAGAWCSFIGALICAGLLWWHARPTGGAGSGAEKAGEPASADAIG